MALGNFDGFHAGHQAVAGEAIRWARAEGRPAIIATFDPHPVRLFKPDAAPFRLTTLDQRERLFEAAGADAMLVFPFDRALAGLTAEEFAAGVRDFALANEADLVGMTPMNPLWVFEGYEITDPWVIMLGFGHNYDKIVQLPSEPRLNGKNRPAAAADFWTSASTQPASAIKEPFATSTSRILSRRRSDNTSCEPDASGVAAAQ